MPTSCISVSLGFEPRPAQPQRITHHEHAGKGHGCRREHGQQAAQHCHRNQHDIIDESPEQVLVYRAHGAPAEIQRGDHRVQIAADERDIAGFDGDIGAGADGETNIGTAPARARR